MRIGLNLLYLIPAHVGGTQTYAESLIEALAKLDKENTYIVFLNQQAADLPLPHAANFERVVCPCDASSRLGRYAWEQRVFPGWLKRHNIDLVHSLGYVCPFKTPCRSVVSIFDVNYVGLGRAMSRLRRSMLRFFVPRSGRSADHVITLSHASKKQIARLMKIDPGKITVTHGAPGVRQNADVPVEWDDLAMRYALETPYIIAFSSLSAHKNLSRLIRAYAQILKRWPEMPHTLVLLGHLPPDSPIPQEISALGLQDRIVSTGYVPDEHVAPLLSHGALFAFPSWYEGFGLPVLEAQSAGLPVVCSTAASIPEVAGEGAIYFDPKSVDEMAAQIERCLRDETLCDALRLKGTLNLERFSWEKTARETLAVYNRVMN